MRICTRTHTNCKCIQKWCVGAYCRSGAACVHFLFWYSFLSGVGLYQFWPFAWLVFLRHTHRHTLNLPTFLPSCCHFSDSRQEYYNTFVPHKSLWQGRATLHMSIGTPHFLTSSLPFYHTPSYLHLLLLSASIGDQHMAPHQRRRVSTQALSPGCVF